MVGQSCYTFDDNQIPDGWTLETGRSGGISNGRLEARPVDGWVRLASPITEPLQMITAQYEGRVEDSFWGSTISLTAWLSNGERFGIAYANEGFEFGNDNQAFIGYSGQPGGYLDVFRHPEEFVDHRFLIELTDGLIHFVVRRSSDLSLVSEQWVSHPDMVIADLVDLTIQVGFNSGSGVTWMDDLCVNFIPLVVDADGDGVNDDVDLCPDSDLRDAVWIGDCDSGVSNSLDADGCSLADIISQVTPEGQNHGAFVSSMAQLLNRLKKAGIITGKEKGALQSCAAQSN